MSFTSWTPISIDSSGNISPFSCLNYIEVPALITGSMASYINNCNLFFNPRLDCDIYISAFDSNDNLLSNSIMNIESSYSNINDPNL